MDKYIEQLKPLFVDIADKIGQGAEFGWEVVIKQQYVEAITTLIFLGLGLVFILISWYFLVKTDWDGYENNQAKTGVPCLIFGIVGGFMTLFSFLYLLSEGTIGKLLNPEYYALEFFINLVK